MKGSIDEIMKSEDSRDKPGVPDIAYGTVLGYVPLLDEGEREIVRDEEFTASAIRKAQIYCGKDIPWL